MQMEMLLLIDLTLTVFSMLTLLFIALPPPLFFFLITRRICSAGPEARTALIKARKAHIRDVFPDMVDKGILFMSLSGLCLTGIVSWTQFLDEDPDTIQYLGWVLTVGFLSFYFARMLFTSYRFYHLTFIGVSACLALVGIISFHFSFPTLEPLVIVIAPIFTFMLLVSDSIKYFMIEFGFVKNPNFGASDGCLSHEKCQKCFESVMKFGLELSVLGLGLLGVVNWANLIDKSPKTQALLSIYIGISFWVFCGAKLLGNGVIFEVFVWVGTVMQLSTFLTVILDTLLPTSDFCRPVYPYGNFEEEKYFCAPVVSVSGYELPILCVSVVLASFPLGWCRIQTILERYLCFDFEKLEE